MAANFQSVTVTNLNGATIPQDNVQNIFALNKGRCVEIGSLNSGADTKIIFAHARDRKFTAWTFVVSDNFSTMQTALVTNGYSPSKVFNFTVLFQDGVQVNAVKPINIDWILFAKPNPDDNTQCIVMYQTLNKDLSELILGLTVAQFVTLTTT